MRKRGTIALPNSRVERSGGWEGASVHTAGATSAVAVILPAYNAAGTISTTLASIAGQSLAPEAVVLVDDGSSDETVSTARRWDRHFDLQIIRLAKNSGPAHARDVGIRHTNCGLIALADADDAWLPDHLQVMISAYARCPGLVTASALRWLPGERLAQRAEPARSIPSKPSTAILESNFVFGSTLFSKADYERVGGYRERFRAAEDWDLWIRMLRSGVSVTRPPHATVLYRLSRSSLSAEDRGLHVELEVLRTAMAEAEEGERVILRKTIRKFEARRHLVAAYAAARSDQRSHARLEGLRAVAGVGPVALRGAFVALCPQRATLLRDRRRFSARRWVGS